MTIENEIRNRLIDEGILIPERYDEIGFESPKCQVTFYGLDQFWMEISERDIPYQKTPDGAVKAYYDLQNYLERQHDEAHERGREMIRKSMLR